MKRLVELFEQAVDGSGVRLSRRTLTLLKGEDVKFSPHEFDFKGYQIIADISSDDAIRLNGVFGTIGPIGSRRARYRELPEALRHKFEQVFDISSFLADDGG
jgi:hypothetical protein